MLNMFQLSQELIKANKNILAIKTTPKVISIPRLEINKPCINISKLPNKEFPHDNSFLGIHPKQSEKLGYIALIALTIYTGHLIYKTIMEDSEDDLEEKGINVNKRLYKQIC